jgi:hypothetical protein
MADKCWEIRKVSNKYENRLLKNISASGSKANH